MQVFVVIGNHNGRILTKIPDLLDDTGVLEFGLDNGDLLEVGHNLLEVHIIMPNGEKFVAPSKGYYKLSVFRSIDSLGEEVTTVTLDYFLEEVNRALNQVNTKAEYVNQTAKDLHLESKQALEEINTKVEHVNQTVNELQQEANKALDEMNTKVEYVNQTAEELRQEVGEDLNSLEGYVNQTADVLRQEMETAIQYVDDTTEDLRQDVSDNLSSLEESVNQTANDLRQEVATAIQYVDGTAEGLRQEVSDSLNTLEGYVNQTANDLRQDVASAIQYVDNTVDDLRQEVGENLDSLVTQEVDNKMTPFVEVVNARLAQTTAELENKVSISAFESGLSTKRDKGIKLDERDMSDEFLQQIAGNTPIHSVPADLSVDAGKLLLPNADVVWELGNVSYSGGVNQDLEGYIRTKDYIYAPKGTTIFSTDNQNYKYSIHLYDLETKTRFGRVWEPSETRYTVSESCYIRLTVRTNPIVAITEELFDIMKNILTINKLLNKMDVVESIEEAKGDGRNTFIPLACFEMYNDNTRAQSIDGIPINNVATFTVINKSSDFSIGIRQRDADGKIVIDNGWTVKDSKKTFTKESGAETIQIVFGKSDNSKFALNDIPINLFEIQFDGVNGNQMEYFNTYVVEYFTRGGKGSGGDEISILNPLNASIKAINHRGYDTHPENTLPAYKKSKDMGFSYVEADVRWTSDNIPVLLHDATINRTGRNADGTEISETINISDITYEEALNYDFGIYKGAEFAGTKIPTLEEFITLCKRLNLHPYIELKGGTDTQIIDAVNVVRKKGMLDKCSWLSSVSICAKVLAEYPKARVVVVTNSTDSAVIDSIAELKTNENDVAADFYIGNITQSMVEYAHSKGIHAEVWTTDNEEDIKKLAD